MELLGDWLLALLPFYVPLVYLGVFWSAKNDSYMSEIEQKYQNRLEEIKLEIPLAEETRGNFSGRMDHLKAKASQDYTDLLRPIFYRRVGCYIIYWVIIFELQPFDQHVDLIEAWCWFYTLGFNVYLFFKSIEVWDTMAGQRLWRRIT